MSHDTSSQASGAGGPSPSATEQQNTSIGAFPARPLTADELDNIGDIETITMVCGIHMLSQSSPPGYISLCTRTESDTVLDLCAFNRQARQWEKICTIEPEQTLSAADSAGTLSREFELTIKRSYQAYPVEYNIYPATIDVTIDPADLVPLFPSTEVTPEWVQQLESLPMVASVTPTHERSTGGIVGLAIAVHTATEPLRLYAAYYRPSESAWTIPLHVKSDLSTVSISDALHRIGVNVTHQLERRYSSYIESDRDHVRSVTPNIHGLRDFPEPEL